MDTGVPVGTAELIQNYIYFTDTGVPVGTTELIQNLYLFYGYGSTCRYCGTYIELILILRIREYL